MSNQHELASLIESGLMRHGNGHWTGSAEQLKAELCQSHAVGKQAEKLLGWMNATGTLLGHLAKREPDKYVSNQVGKSRGRIWTICLNTLEHPQNTVEY